MSDVLVFVYLLCFAAVFGMTCTYMFMMMRSTLKDINQRNIHPEMADVKSGEELLVFSLEEDDDDDGDVIIIRK
tara:strand:- start:1362 stop:1583 length:222 start_codon:yes stop_codon:yes gene_type:complete